MALSHVPEYPEGPVTDGELGGRGIGQQHNDRPGIRRGYTCPT